MERKTKFNVEENKQDILVTREFDLPLELLFMAYEDPEIIEQWMGSKMKHEARKNGPWELQKKDENGTVVFQASGVYHDFVPQKKITRTLEMANAGLPAQLEFLEFEKLTDDTSKLTMHIVYRSAAFRDQMVSWGMDKGMSMAHNKLQSVISKLKS